MNLPPPPTGRREPEPSFEIEPRRRWVEWKLNGYPVRLVHPAQFRTLGDVFLEAGWPRNFNALNDAELALTEAVNMPQERT